MRFNKFLPLFTILFFPGFAFSQNTLTGKVINWENQNVSGCQVRLSNTSETGVTNSTGNFIIANLPVGQRLQNLKRNRFVRLKGNQLHFYNEIEGEVSIEAFNLKGQALYKLINTTLENGSYYIKPSSFLGSIQKQNIVLLRIKTETYSKSISFRNMYSLDGDAEIHLLESNSSPLLKRKAAPIDTLTLICTGNITRKIEIDSYNTDVGTITVRPPNFIIVYLDDAAYGDVGFSRNTPYPTPNMDKLAEDGRIFTNFYVSQAVCTASRTGLLTGTYSNRINLTGALGPNSARGIHENEITIAELVKQKNYATAVFGKWHLGDSQKFLPLQNGFDEYFGIPYSNDMWPFHPVNPSNWPPLPLFDGNQVVNASVDSAAQVQFTTQFTNRSVQFINNNKDKPFFLYVPHPQVHVPLFVSSKYAGQSGVGPFGDVMMEVDWSVGEIVKAVNDNGLEEETMIVISSDNGPWLVYGDHAGNTAGHREGKHTTFDGGMKVFCAMKWPGQIPGGSTTKTMMMTIDLLPTIANLIDAQLPNHIIDGKDAWSVISGTPNGDPPQPAYYFYRHNELQAVRTTGWKYHYPHSYHDISTPGGNGQPGSSRNSQIVESLFDLDADFGESQNVIGQNRAMADSLKALGDQFNTSLNNNKRAAGQR